MLRLVLLCLCATALTWAQSGSSNSAQSGNTRLFGGLGGLASAFNQITGNTNRPTQFGGNHNHNQGNPFGGRPIQTGFGVNQGFNNGFGGGFNQGGFNQGGFNQGGFNQGGFGQGGFGNTGFVQPVVPSQSCRRWCRTPQGQAYCCEGANEPISAAVTKRGQCPPVRPSCPPTRFGQPPRTCSSDGACGGVDKCCFDTCLQHHTCKPPIGFGRR